jgi:Histidine kinase-, DNA gyrase B-, and HSP90-like ATPase
MSTVKIDFVPHFGAFVIETLTLGMYGESRNAIREYVQNSRDSLLQAVDDGLITAAEARIDVGMDADRNGLTIRDNGHGIRIENAAKVLASIGASNKDYRVNAGFRGIGRLAGIVFCDRLIFRTKSKGQTQFTEVVIRADELRDKLSPDETYAKDAAQTLAECVDATLQDDAEADAHYFEVRLEGFHNPPAECRDVELMRTFLGQVAPLPYAADFPFGAEIEAAALRAGLPVESIHLFVKDGNAAAVELFKPYSSDVAVKRTRTPLSVSYAESPTGKWFGWLGRKRVSGAIKEKHAGIRVRVRNIQIDDTKIIRDIFAESRLTTKARSSWGRFAEWYVGEIFVDPQAAIPNARRDGFEENQSWSVMRDELDLQVATPLGKLAYRTSKADKLSIANLTAAMGELESMVDQLEAEGSPTMERLERPLFAATDLRSRLASAKGLYEGDEVAQLDALAMRLSAVQLRLEALVALAPAHSCDAEIAAAIEEVAEQILRELRDRLGPQDWLHARSVIANVTGVKPT